MIQGQKCTHPFDSPEQHTKPRMFPESKTTSGHGKVQNISTCWTAGKPTKFYNRRPRAGNKHRCRRASRLRLTSSQQTQYMSKHMDNTKERTPNFIMEVTIFVQTYGLHTAKNAIYLGPTCLQVPLGQLPFRRNVWSMYCRGANMLLKYLRWDRHSASNPMAAHRACHYLPLTSLFDARPIDMSLLVWARFTHGFADNPYQSGNS